MRAVAATASALVLALSPCLVGSASAARPAPSAAVSDGVYVVVLSGSPLGAYDGSAAAHRADLRARQDRALEAVGDPEVLYHYTTTLNGFAAPLTAAQVKTLRGTPGVRLVERAVTARLDERPSAVRSVRVAAQAPADRAGPPRAGRGVVIGVVDSGIWPENPSFAALPPAGPGGRLRGFAGGCQDGDRWGTDTCTSKVVTARWFVRGFGADRISAAEVLSPRDMTGHGSHSAAVAAGNSGVAVTIEGDDFGHVSGVAPAARLALYKACWTAPDPDDDGCNTADTIAAIDQATADGVDVLDYPISSTVPSAAVEQAFRGAAAAGVFVATSAGNAGPRRGTVRHPSPWTTTVAASVRQLYQGTLTLGDGRSFVGAMISDTDVPSARLLYAADAPAPGASRRDAALCVPGSLDAELVENAAVVCDRGEVARLDKSRAVRRAGGLAMVLANTGPDSVDADLHAVPTVHLGAADGRAVKAYISGAGGAARASIEADSGAEQTPPRILEFSSRGPTPDGAVLKPDLAAPGGNVLAAVSPAAATRRPWDFRSGTSVATAHVAGLAARVLAEHPDWSPAAVRSAMMTTALAGAATTTPFEAGAGEVSARRALDPGLVYDAAPATAPGRPSSLNLPSISVPALVGSATVHRTVTNVSDSVETYTAKVTGLHGVDAAVVPDAFTLQPGESASFRVTFSAKKHARYGRFVAGDLVWRGSAGHRVRSPLVVRAQPVEAPDEVTGATLDGSLFVDLTAGVTGTLDVRGSGLVGASPVDVALSPGGFDPASPGADTATYQQSMQVSEGAEAMRVQVDADDGGDDFDLYVYRDDRLVAASNGASADETVTLRRPAPGSYQVYVNLAAGNDGAGAAVTGWVLDPSRTVRLALGPRPMTVDGGAPFRLRVAWSDLDTSRRWWGYLDYSRHAGRTYLTLG